MIIKSTMPIKGYLKRYIYWRENLAPTDPLDTAGAGEIGWVLSGLLSGNINPTRQAIPDDLPEQYDDHLEIQVPIVRFNECRFSYSLDSIRFFNTYIYRHFHEALLLEVLVKKSIGIPESKTIYEWMDRLDLYDTITFDALKKASYRLRKSRNIPHFRSVNCPYT